MATKVYHKRLKAVRVANALKRELLEFGVDRVEVCGSIRRGKPEVADIDVIVLAPHETFKMLQWLDGVQESKQKTPKMLKFERNGIGGQIWWVPEPEEWATFLVFATGSGELNVEMRARALWLGYDKLSQHGLFKNGKAVKIKTEKALFKRLEMDYLQPVERSL
jgi:DNA polymerase/3'-5' exonuclease PolX